MKAKLLSAFVCGMLLTVGAYAQDTTAMSKKEIRQQERAERKARLKENMNETGQTIKQKAKVANDAVEKGAKKVGETVSKGLDKAENAILTEGDKLKAKRDSSRAVRRDSL